MVYALSSKLEILRHLGPIVGHLGAILGPAWGHLGPAWAHLGAILGPSWRPLGNRGVFLGPLEAILGLPWGHLGATLGQPWGNLGAASGPPGASLGPSWGHLWEQSRPHARDAIPGPAECAKRSNNMASMPYNGHVDFDAAGGGETDASRIQLTLPTAICRRRGPAKCISTPRPTE